MVCAVGPSSANEPQSPRPLPPSKRMNSPTKSGLRPNPPYATRLPPAAGNGNMPRGPPGAGGCAGRGGRHAAGHRGAGGACAHSGGVCRGGVRGRGAGAGREGCGGEAQGGGERRVTLCVCMGWGSLGGWGCNAAVSVARTLLCVGEGGMGGHLDPPPPPRPPPPGGAARVRGLRGARLGGPVGEWQPQEADQRPAQVRGGAGGAGGGAGGGDGSRRPRPGAWR